MSITKATAIIGTPVETEQLLHNTAAATAAAARTSCCSCQSNNDQLPLPTTNTATLRSNHSNASTATVMTIDTCPAAADCVCDATLLNADADEDGASMVCLRNATCIATAPDDLEADVDSTLRYSFKGFPPDLYSPKKEFIYTRPLVEKQLVLKKTCEWWFYKNKCNSNMSTHWKHNAFLIFTALALLLLGFIIFASVPIGSSHSNSNSKKPTTNNISQLVVQATTTTMTTTTTTTQHPPPTPYPIELQEIKPQYMNDTFIDDDWSDEDDIENDIEDLNYNLPDERMSDYVKPIKVHNFTLNADDLLYESKRNHNGSNIPKKDYYSAFSVTGTFRTKSSQIWDPHPEYILHTLDRTLHLVLHQDTSFIPPKTFRVIRILNNRTTDEEEEEEDMNAAHYLGCYYKGYVEGDEQSMVAVSLCNGMTGYIKASFGTLLIQPVNQTSNDDSDILHKVWRHARRNARHAVAAQDLGLDLEIVAQAIESKLLRKKRNYDEDHLFTMEVLVAVDGTMRDFHGSDLRSYILTLISIVSNIFADASIGNSIHISVAQILILPNITASRHTGRKATASELLKFFCELVAKMHYHYDTAMLITRDQICRSEREAKCDTLGLAELGTVCKRSSCSVVQDNGLPAAFTMAHELGHILNMPHDDDTRCNQFNKPGAKRTLHIMSSIMGDAIHPWSWSDCSRFYVSEFLEKEDKTCLEDTPAAPIKNYNTRMPGEIYSLDHQCQLIHGNQSVYCYLGEECKRLWCKATSNLAGCQSSNLPWADGTPCNQDRYWCQKGECVPRDGSSLQVVHGGWGPWSPFTPCSLTCGGGVQESQRECNNPLPKNYGKYCAGSRKKYRSCNTQPCPIGSLDSREQQCYDMNGRNLNIKGIPPYSKWVPKYGLATTDKCKLYCRLEDDSAYFRLLEKVKDGTTCSFDTFDKCINGICRPAGCDNELNSIAKLDKCGVCEGRNDTCEEFTGNFYVSDLQKKPKSDSVYYHVVTIPKGASNIVITQPGYHATYYIALSDDQNNFLLNGNHVINSQKKVDFYAGVTFEYNGSTQMIERVNTSYSRKLKRDLNVQIISITSNDAKDNDSILISYTYTMDKPYYLEPEVEIYSWDMPTWSNCDAICQGISYRVPACVSKTKGLKVAPQFCDETAKPKVDYRECNTECRLTLNVTSISKCSASCGMLGSREKTFNCIKTYPGLGRSSIVDMSYCETKFEIVRHEHCREGCWEYTAWSMCSRSCGTGTQTRSIGCFLNQTRVSDELCDSRLKSYLKDTLRSCNTEPCHRYIEEVSKSTRAVNHWTTGEWGECNDRCEKNRTVSCTHPYGYGCSTDRKPISKRKCCNIKYVSNWSNCSVECGSGVRRKELHCARVYKPEVRGAERKRVIINESYCRHLQRPTPKRLQKPCKVSCKWSTSEWTLCPADCNDDYQARSVYCESVHGNKIHDRYCDDTKKPTYRKICNNCVRRQTKIISTCNCEGYERRRTVCYDSSHRLIPCPTKERITKHKCAPPRSCVAQSCADIQRIHRYYKDREYTIYVRSKPKKIYCHNMHSQTPKEYITLNPTENYSIYYEYKTHYPDRCPPFSRRHEFHNSYNTGRTNFRKLRVNITDLRVIENDYTFADTVGTQPQPYASAGDCYNRNAECPQGDFSMNLKHTGFAIRPGTVWNRYGSKVIMKISEGFETMPLTRRAFCGGYCGHCSISPQTGLYLDVI